MTKTLAASLALVTVALAATQLTSSAAASRGPEPTRKAGRPARIPTPVTGSIVLRDRTWVCTGPVNLKSVTVTINPAPAGSVTRPPDAVHLRPGCTGHIGRLTVTQ